MKAKLLAEKVTAHIYKDEEVEVIRAVNDGESQIVEDSFGQRFRVASAHLTLIKEPTAVTDKTTNSFDALRMGLMWLADMTADFLEEELKKPKK